MITKPLLDNDAGNAVRAYKAVTAPLLAPLLAQAAEELAARSSGMSPCCRCGKVTRSHWDGRLVWCHGCWEVRNTEEGE